VKKIIFTGGGSAGHVVPNLALISKLETSGWDIHYVGSKNGIERNLIEERNISYYPISSGKLRRYFDFKNFQDPFRVLKGLAQSYSLLRKLKPDLVFSKGGFVSVPVVIAGKLTNTPVFIHESDITPGLANKIAGKFATKVFVTFEETVNELPKEKAVYTGSPIRDEVLNGDKEKGLKFLGFTSKKPVIAVMGGSLGSARLNNAVRESLNDLLKKFQLVHLCGKGNLDPGYDDVTGYRQFEYLSTELPDVLAASDLVTSRAGSNSIFEFLTLKKPMLLIPLPRSSSRGDQLLNAKSFEKKGFSSVLYDEDLTKESFIQALSELYENRNSYIEMMSKYSPGKSIDNIIEHIEHV
jgi:UDP-N-acetylglucosamine--N-acetylmuramyl-(pentapeptide) pyrophosphoryl-undecaprenol N-acetylglucosamine transferase